MLWKYNKQIQIKSNQNYNEHHEYTHNIYLYI